MKQRLEDFIDDNRDDFDSYEPGKKVWKAIEEQLPGNNKKRAIVLPVTWSRWSSVAVAVIIIVSSVYYFTQPTIKPGSPPQVVEANNDMPPEYTEEVYHFTKLIELKHKQLQKIEKEQPELYWQFAGDISRLDSNYQALRRELPGHPNQEVLIQAMIGNLKWQIELLNEQLTIIQKIKQSKNRTNEKISKSA
ncbi:MAG: hypothetical protein ABIN89_23750 [Chitinophagaceae bacterium]